MMKNKDWVLVDSDFWLGIYLVNDLHIEKSQKILQKFRKQKTPLVITSAIIGEVATVISHRMGQKQVRTFLNTTYAGNFEIIHITEEIHTRAIKLFSQQSKKGTSYVDCTNIATMEIYDISYICAFDKIYHQQFGLQNVCYNTPT